MQEVAFSTLVRVLDEDVVVTITACRDSVLTAVKIWQLGGLDVKRIVLYLWSCKRDMERYYFAGIGIYVDGIYPRSVRCIFCAFVFEYSSLAEGRVDGYGGYRYIVCHMKEIMLVASIGIFDWAIVVAKAINGIFTFIAEWECI